MDEIACVKPLRLLWLDDAGDIDTMNVANENVKERIEELGGRWDSGEECWQVPAKHKHAVERLIIEEFEEIRDTATKLDDINRMMDGCSHYVDRVADEYMQALAEFKKKSYETWKMLEDDLASFREHVDYSSALFELDCRNDLDIEARRRLEKEKRRYDKILKKTRYLEYAAKTEYENICFLLDRMRAMPKLT